MPEQYIVREWYESSGYNFHYEGLLIKNGKGLFAKTIARVNYNHTEIRYHGDECPAWVEDVAQELEAQKHDIEVTINID